ncbi:nicotinate-nucleotide adenylyltransferase [Chitinimonas arctica]|uniref:Probable nicotinate-nucleotide adenylyltransferase n=1 Tax=Chitinimonas arctica TaxID=2594795 RepID=A0A516SGG2_9NEIS|nr:nicotinate-nucleotide adenylyltransferase [Chitinimonas arctica]QDQ27222.1 nicotinate-nucleotide adenylyltransferase [Chitinimonas arctica]
MAGTGLFGGTFDPIHYGHLRIAEEFADALALDQVRLMPTANPPHRSGALASNAQRLEMVRLAIADNPRLAADDRELRRDGTCYTIDTLSEMRAALGPSAPLAWLIGADSFLSLDRWHRWRELFDLGCLAVACRPGFELAHWKEVAAPALVKEVLPRIQTLSVTGQVELGTIRLLPTTPLAISSTAIRAQLANGHSARYLVPDAVLDYAGRHLFYRI